MDAQCIYVKCSEIAVALYTTQARTDFDNYKFVHYAPDKEVIEYYFNN